MTGRWAPSPTGDLHIGNLRTGLLAWLFARSTGGRFLWRFEDLDITSKPEFRESQLRDFDLLGLTWDGEAMSQSDRLEVYADVLSNLIGDGHTYECFCSRREIREAPTAPHTHLPDGAYPGTCRSLTASERSDRAATGRPPALRLRADEAVVTVPDLQLGDYTGVVDDVVLRRGDGTPAYNLVVVIDDDAQGVTQVVRGDDLLPSTPRQVHLTRLLNLTVPEYAHVPLVVASDGRRLAKRFGAVTMADRIALGETPLDVLNTMLRSLGLAEVAHIDELHDVAAVFDRSRLPREPWEYHPTG